MKNTKLVAVVATGLGLALTVSACGSATSPGASGTPAASTGAAAGTPVKGGTLRLLSGTQTEHWDPQRTYVGAQIELGNSLPAPDHGHRQARHRAGRSWRTPRPTPARCPDGGKTCLTSRTARGRTARPSPATMARHCAPTRSTSSPAARTTSASSTSRPRGRFRRSTPAPTRDRPDLYDGRHVLRQHHHLQAQAARG